MKERVLSLALCGLLLLTGCQNETVQEEIWELEAEDAAVFADGEAADRWRGYQNGLREPWVLYELSDGTVLLQENDTGGPEGSAAYAALSEDVQAAVSGPPCCRPATTAIRRWGARRSSRGWWPRLPPPLPSAKRRSIW